jgi:hypothetical protein
VVFVGLGLVLYAGLYAAAEALVYRHAQYNRFFQVKKAPRADYDHLILGASHAAVFDYRDLNARLEAMTGSAILNLSIVGAGVTVNRLLLDYFLVGHRASNVVYVLDSFALYSSEWNEERLSDARLFDRAPFDTALARLLFRSPAPRPAVWNYLTGFSKINNRDRFERDARPEEGSRFDRTYRPVDQIDQERLAYLYPEAIDAEAVAVRDRYLAELGDLIEAVTSRGSTMIVIRPPLPARFRRLIPGEDAFDAALERRLDGTGAALHDFSGTANDEKFFFDSDHLNQVGVLNFFERHFVPVLASRAP